jgi:predicted ATPase
MPVEVATLYLRAGNKAIEKAAFDQATGYLLAGIGLLPANHWRDHYQLSLELYSSAAEGFFCTGDFEQMSANCHEVIRQADRPILDKRRVYMVLIDATGAAGRQAEALQLCRDVLAKLGHKFPNHAVLLHVLAGIVKTKSALKKTTSHELVANLPTMDDPKKQLVMAMLDKSVTWMYNTKSDLLPLAVFKGLQMTMKEGVSAHSPVMFALVGFLLSGVVFDFKGGASFGDQAVELLKQAKGSRKVESRVQFIVHFSIFCWLRPISLSIKPLLAAYEIGMATGDTESGCWSIYFYLEYQFRTGMPLETLIADCAFYAEHVREVKMNNILALLKILWQAALFLTGANSFDGYCTGELVRQDADLAAAGDFHDYLFLAIHRMLMYTQFVLGRHDLVYESIKKTSMDNNGYEKGLPGIAGQ